MCRYTFSSTIKVDLHLRRLTTENFRFTNRIHISENFRIHIQEKRSEEMANFSNKCSLHTLVPLLLILSDDYLCEVAKAEKIPVCT